MDVMCPGFASDCLETLEEINMECREASSTRGKRFEYTASTRETTDPRPDPAEPAPHGQLADGCTGQSCSS